MVLVLDKRALIAHLGDCRGYLLNNGQLQQLTKDHTLTQLLVDCGEITTEEALVHPGRHQLTQFVGISTESLPVTRIVPLSPGDRLLLCSDGVSGILSREQILESLQNGKSPEEACRFLVAAANEAGGDDNATAVVIDVGDAE
jgi:protein phosphatase